MRYVKILFLLFVFCLPTIAAAQSIDDIRPVLDELGGEPCTQSEFTCFTITVPRDHSNPDDAQTIDLAYAVLPASGERKGMFVTVVGGPGYAGLEAAQWYTDAMSDEVRENFDIVFFDQRGIGASDGVYCPAASAVYYQQSTSLDTPEDQAAAIESARTYAEACQAEMGDTALLPYVGTEQQAIHDLNLFREIVGDEKIWLYGESYGTQFVQTYAAAYPETLAAIILDGTVDLTLSGFEFYRQQAQAFHDVLIATLEACNEDETCAADFGGDALAAFDDLYAELAAAPVTVDFPLPSGETEPRPFTLTNLESVITYNVYDEASRGYLLRLLAAGVHGDLLPLMRELYFVLAIDPITLEALPNTDWSDASFYAIECSDYTFAQGTPDEQAQAFVEVGIEAAETIPYMSARAISDMPCVFWGALPPAERPEPFAAEGIPTLVLNSTTDPATPYNNGVDVFNRLDDAYLVIHENGPHVIYGRGVSCVDDAVTEFLVNDSPPAGRETTCEGVVYEHYEPLSPTSAADFETPLDAMYALDTDSYFMPEYYAWDLETPTNVGCAFGGTLSFEATDIGEAFTFSDCAFFEGFIVTGTGVYDYEADTLTFDVDVTGLADGHLTYVNDIANDTLRVVGDYDGQAIELSDSTE